MADETLTPVAGDVWVKDGRSLYVQIVGESLIHVARRGGSASWDYEVFAEWAAGATLIVRDGKPYQPTPSQVGDVMGTAQLCTLNEVREKLLATVREDDDEPVTEEWLRAKDQNGHDDISALLAEVDRLRSRYETEVRDNCEADTAIRDIVRPVIGDAAVDGDSIHRPGMVDVVQMVVDRLRAENRQLTNANAHLQHEVYFLRRRPE